MLKSPKKGGKKVMRNKYITERERYQIEALYRKGCTVKEIATLLDRCLATIYNELKRGMTTLIKSDLTEYQTYCADVAQNKAVYNATNKGRDLKIGNDYEYVNFATELIRDKKYSPYAVIQHIKNNNIQFKTEISSKNTLYSYIRMGLFEGVTMDSLPCPRKTQGKGKISRRVALNNTVCKSIEDRDKEILNRKEIGHWEMDTVVSGKGGKGALLVLTERATRYEEIYKIPAKSQESVRNCLDNIEKEIGLGIFQQKYKTITCDNGVEFLNPDFVEKSIDSKSFRTALYFCHPYCSCERGSNENQNRMIRRFVPKGSDISLYTDECIDSIQKWINNYPRKIHNGRTAMEIYCK